MEKRAFAITFAMVLMTSVAYAESLTVTTYYPAPFGSYDRIQLVPRVDAGVACDEGIFYVENTNNTVQYCKDGISFEPLSKWDQTNNNIYLTDTVSNPGLLVGIGTTTPFSKLDITASNPGLTIKRTSNGTNHNIYFRNSGNAFPVRIYTTGNTHADLRFAIGHANINPTALSDVMTIENSGNVGIGTTNPNAKLDIDGDIRLKADGINSGPLQVQWATNGYYAVYAPN